jgi:hypothetical protein
VVGKRSIIPRGVRIGRNVKVAGDVRTSDFLTKVIKTGSSVEPAGERRRARRPAAVTMLAGEEKAAAAGKAESG